MSRARRFLSSAFVTAIVALHGCYWGVSSGGGDCYPYCYDDFSTVAPSELQSEPAYEDTW